MSLIRRFFHHPVRRLHTGTSLTFDYSRLLPTTPSITSVTRHDHDRLVHVQWSDGAVSKYAYRWLRDFSPDDKTITVSSALTAREMPLGKLENDLAPVKVENSAIEVTITWPEGHVSKYNADWLAYRDLSNERMRETRRHHHITETSNPREWNTEEITKCAVPFLYFEIIFQTNKILPLLVGDVLGRGHALVAVLGHGGRPGDRRGRACPCGHSAQHCTRHRHY